MDRQKRLEIVHNNEMETDWREPVNIGDQCAKNRLEILKFISEFQEVWDGRIALNSIGHKLHPTDHTGRTIYQLCPILSWTEAKWIKTTNIERVLHANVIEPAESEWASPIVLVKYKDRLL